MKMTIQTLAELAGVSKGTVSKVLNNQPGVGAEKREQIKKLIQQLDFHPDASARALALQRRGIIGFLIPQDIEQALSGYFWSAVFSSIARNAEMNSYSILLLTAPIENGMNHVIDKVVKNKTLDGLIIGADQIDSKVISTLILNKFPFVFFGKNPVFNHYCVDTDNRQGAMLAVNHMVKQGYKKIGALLGPARNPSIQERYVGYCTALIDANLKWQASAYCEYDKDDLQANLAALLRTNPDMDGLFVAAGGNFYFDALEYLENTGINFKTFGITVFDDYPFLNFTYPKVTAVKQPLSKAGAECFCMLQQIMEGKTPESRQIVLPVELVVRQSCRENNSL